MTGDHSLEYITEMINFYARIVILSRLYINGTCIDEKF